MCGIAGVHLRDPELRVNMDDILDSLLESIEPRGDDATGYVAIGGEVDEWQKASCGARVFNQYRRIVPRGTRTLLAHTRLATQGLPAFIENNHPIKRGPFYIVHNGHVNNDAELFRKAERMRFGEVDSEAIAARLSSLGNLELLSTVMEEISGYAAVAAIDERDPGRLVVARGTGSPLYVYDGRRIVMFASTREAIEKAHAEHVGQISEKRLQFIDEGTQIEWNDGYCTISAFKVPVKKLYTYTSKKWDNYDWNDDKWWKNYKSDSKLELTQTSKDDYENEWNTLNQDYFECDNCAEMVTFGEVEYRHITEERISFIFCEMCADMWDDREGDLDFTDEFEAQQEVIDVEADDEDDFIGGDPTPSWMDEYENANNSVLKYLSDFGGRILGI